MMSDFEIRANNIKTAIEIAEQRVNEFGYKEDDAKETVSRVIGMFITWLISCEEARQMDLHGDCSFVKCVIDNIPAIDNPVWENYIEPPHKCSLKDRVEALWGIRIAFTHCDGDINLISNKKNKEYAIKSSEVFDSVFFEGDKLILTSGLYHEAIRTMVQVRDLLK